MATCHGFPRRHDARSGTGALLSIHHPIPRISQAKGKCALGIPYPYLTLLLVRRGIRLYCFRHDPRLDQR